MLVRVQLDRFEREDWAVLLLYPGGGRGFGVPRELLPEGATPGDVYEVRFERDPRETERVSSENRRLMDGLLGRDDA